MPGEMIRCCPPCGEPVVFTFEFPGFERYCVECSWKGDIFGGVEKPATDERMARFGELQERYDTEAAERAGRAAPTTKKAEPPVCGGCGTTARGPLVGDKPAHWYSRTIDGATSYACSRSCIPSREMVMPW